MRNRSAVITGLELGERTALSEASRALPKILKDQETIMQNRALADDLVKIRRTGGLDAINTSLIGRSDPLIAAWGHLRYSLQNLKDRGLLKDQEDEDIQKG